MFWEGGEEEADSPGLWEFGFCSKCSGKAGNYPGMDHVLCFKKDVHVFAHVYTHSCSEIRSEDPLGLSQCL